MARDDVDVCAALLQKYANDHTTIVTKTALSKLTVEGAGMQRQSGVASKLFGALAKADICISIITTSDTNISFCVDSEKSSDAVRIISDEFAL
jgi:aspartokinase